MNIYATLVLLGMALALLDLILVAAKGSPFANHILLQLGVILIGLGVITGSPIITSLHK